jgi:hypothetical protein
MEAAWNIWYAPPSDEPQGGEESVHRTWLGDQYTRLQDLVTYVLMVDQVEIAGRRASITVAESTAQTKAEDVVDTRILRKLPSETHTLQRPLHLTVHEGPGYYWVAIEDFALTGAGETVEQAIEDYAYALIEYYEELTAEREHLAPHLLDHLEYLDTVVVRE